MHFFIGLKLNVSVDKIADEFVVHFLSKSSEMQDLCPETSADFLNDLLNCIGFNAGITSQQTETNVFEFDHAQLQAYIFDYNHYIFTKLKKFFCEIFQCVINYHMEFMREELEKDDDDSIEYREATPIEFLIQLIGKWLSMTRQLLAADKEQKHFEEPIARINFYLLQQGMHELRKEWYFYEFIDKICHRLCTDAWRGLNYSQFHNEVFNGLLGIFAKDFHLFYEANPESMDFFYKAFLVEINSSTHFKLYEQFLSYLNEFTANICEGNNIKLNILKEYLIEKHMLQVYFNTLIMTKHRSLRKTQMECLNFLYKLQENLLTLDQFSREFMEAMLHLIAKYSGNTTMQCLADRAAELYVTMMNRKVTDAEQINHIMEYYLEKVFCSSFENLKAYINCLFKYFKYLLNYKHHMSIISNAQLPELGRLMSCWNFVFAFEHLISEMYFDKIQHILEILPEFLENLTCQKSKGVVIQVYNMVNFGGLPAQINTNFVHYAAGVYTNLANDYEYPLLMNIFTILNKFLIISHEWHHLEMICGYLEVEYLKMTKELNDADSASVQSQETLPNALFSKFLNCLKRMNIMTKTKYDLCDEIPKLLKNLQLQFLQRLCVKELYLQPNYAEIELYALEFMTSLIMKLIKSEEHKDIAIKHSQNVFSYVWKYIENMEVSPPSIPLHKVRVYFSIILNLLMSNQSPLQNDDYNRLIQILIAFIFQNPKTRNSLPLNDYDENSKYHPQHQEVYKKLMLKHFTQFHTQPIIKLATNAVWRLCIHYKMPFHCYDEELKMLLNTLSKYHSDIYRHITAVLIYNLPKHEYLVNNVKYIATIVEEHKSLIDNNNEIESKQSIKLHIVLSVLEIIEKALNVLKGSTINNRLESLKYLKYLLEDSDINDVVGAKDLLLQQFEKVEKFILTAGERQVLNSFMEHLQL